MNPGVPDRPPESGGIALPITVRADWDDIDAAVSRAAPHAACAPLDATTTAITDAGRSRTVRLLSIDDQVASVTFTGTHSDRTSDPAPIAIDAEFGRPTDAPRAAALAGLIAHELAALAGRDIAPR